MTGVTKEVAARREIAERYTIPPHAMRRVVVESPYSGDTDSNCEYARACARDCLVRGESPYLSHLLLALTGILDDANKIDRAHGINAGHAWMHGAHAVVVYTDRGISEGMQQGIDSATILGIPVERRILPGGTEPTAQRETESNVLRETFDSNGAS